MGLNRYNGTLSVALLLALVGCGDGGDGGGGVGRQKQLLTGRVESGAMFQGALVDAHEVSSDGEEVPASNTDGEGTVSASGEYSVEIDVASNVDATVIVEATHEGERRAAVVESSFSGSGSITVEPMTTETTFESDVYVQALADGTLCDGCTSAIVLDWVGSASAEANASASSEASISAAADVTASAADAFHAAIVASTDEGSASINAALDAHLEARAVRAAALDSATTQVQIDAAEEDYIDAVASAYVEAGVDLDAQAAAAQAAAENASARLETIASLNASMSAALRADIEVQRAAAISWAIEAHANATGASSANLEAAAETLRSDLQAAATAGASANAEIEAAWGEYRASVRAELRASLETAGQVAFDAAVTALESAAVTLHSTLDASFSVSGNVSTWLEPLFAFSGEAQTNALISAGANDAQASAMVKILLAIELAAS